jgi:hypothetical protein
MPISINVYARQAVTYLSAYGLQVQRGHGREHCLFGILCSTDIAQYTSSFEGRVDQLLASGVAELPTGNGYFKYGDYLRNYYTGVQYVQYGNLSSNFLIRPEPYTVSSFNVTSLGGLTARFTPSTRQFPLFTPPPAFGNSVIHPVQSLTWTATTGPLSAKSLLLCYRTPLPSASSELTYGASYPLAMIDFGGTVTAVAGQTLAVPYPPVADIIRWTID